MAKKNFREGINNLISSTKEEANSILDDNKYSFKKDKDDNSFVSTSINANADLIKDFKVALTRLGQPVHLFFEKEIEAIVKDMKVSIEEVKDDNSFTKYSFRMFKGSRDILKEYCSGRKLVIRDVYVHIMKHLVNELKKHDKAQN